MVGQGFLQKYGEYNQLKLTDSGWQMLRGQGTPRLLKPAEKSKPKREAAVFIDSWEGVDRDLFEELRTLRREKADRIAMPAYIIFTDTTLRDMARRRPTTLDAMRQVRGMGEKKLADYGAEFVTVIAEYCRDKSIPSDVTPPPVAAPAAGIASDTTSRPGRTLSALGAARLFREGKSLDQVAKEMGRAVSTVNGYLCEFIQNEGQADPTPWVPAETARRIEDVAAEVGLDRLAPIHELLNNEIPYDEIRIVVECLRVRQQLGDWPPRQARDASE